MTNSTDTIPLLKRIWSPLAGDPGARNPTNLVTQRGIAPTVIAEAMARGEVSERTILGVLSLVVEPPGEAALKARGAETHQRIEALRERQGPLEEQRRSMGLDAYLAATGTLLQDALALRDAEDAYMACHGDWVRLSGVITQCQDAISFIGAYGHHHRDYGARPPAPPAEPESEIPTP